MEYNIITTFLLTSVIASVLIIYIRLRVSEASYVIVRYWPT